MALINTNVLFKSGYDPTKYEQGVSKINDAATVTKWYKYNQQMPLTEGDWYFFIRSIASPGDIYSTQFTVDCDGAVVACPIQYQGVTRVGANAQCPISFSNITRISGADCTISFQNVTRVGVTEPPPTEQPVGDSTWTYPDYGAESGYDFENRPFIRQSAPTIPYASRLKPYLTGIDYGFSQQTAKFVALFKRLPPFTLRDRFIHMMGSWYNSASANSHFTRGITSMTTLPELRIDGSPQDVRALPFERKNEFLSDEVFWDYALILANELQNSNPSDARIPILRQFGTKPGNKATANEAAFVALGRRMWEGERGTTSFNGKGIKYWTIDIEYTDGWDIQRIYQGYIYKGFCQRAAEDGQAVVPIAYANATFIINVFTPSDINPSTGLPHYMDADRDPYPADDPLTNTFNIYGGVLTTDGYLRAIWDEQPFYQRNNDGSLVILVGQPVMVNNRPNLTVYGQTVSSEEGESDQCLQDIYIHATRLYMMHHNAAGSYPSVSTQRKSFLANCKLGSYQRYTNEGMDRISQNNRPVPFWITVQWTLLDLFTMDHEFCWGIEWNHPPKGLGEKDPRNVPYSSDGVVEAIAHAAHRYSVNDPIHQGNFKWCWFNLPMYARNTGEGHRYYQKPIIFGKIRPNSSKAILEIIIAYPGSDNNVTDFTIWVDDGTTKSLGYTARLQSGRKTYYDAFQLPDAFSYADLEGKYIYISWLDLVGFRRYGRGDYREAIPGNISVPNLYPSA